MHCTVQEPRALGRKPPPLQTSWRACATPDGSWLSVRLPSLSSESPISASRSAAFLFQLYTDQQPALGLGKEMGGATQAKHTAEDATSEGPRRNRERARARARGGARKERSWIRISWRWRHSTVAARALDWGLQPVHEWGARFSAPTRFLFDFGQALCFHSKRTLHKGSCLWSKRPGDLRDPKGSACRRAALPKLAKRELQNVTTA